MAYALLLDNDPKFILAAQKMLPNNTEWLATMDVSKAEDLVDIFSFDIIILRKKNACIIDEIILYHVNNKEAVEQKPFKKIVILPSLFWKKCLRKAYREVLYDISLLDLDNRDAEECHQGGL